MRNFAHQSEETTPIRNKSLFASLLFSVFSISVFSQVPSIEWQKSYGGTNSENITYAVQLNEQRIKIFGGSSSNNFDINCNHGGICSNFSCVDVWMIMLDSIGNLLSQKCIGGTGDDIITQSLKLNNDHFISFGGTTSNNGDVSGNHSPGLLDAWVFETDTNENLISQKCYGGTNQEVFYSIKSTLDGGYIAVGETESNDGDVSGNHNPTIGNSDIWVVKLDTLKNIQWQKCLGGTWDDKGISISIVADGFVIAGYANSNDGDILGAQGGYDFCIFKIDSVGDLIWEKSYGGSNDEILKAMVKTNDAGFILTGYSYSQNGDVNGSHDTISTLSDIWVLKLDSAGNMQWQKCYGGSGDDGALSIIQDKDSGFVITGYTKSIDGDITNNHLGGFCMPYACYDFWVVKVDSIGNLQWDACLGGSSADIGEYCALADSAGYIICGNTFSNDGDMIGNINHGNVDAWIIKLADHEFSIDAEALDILYPTSIPLCDNSFSPILRIRNNGTDTLLSALINYQVDSGNIQSFNWAGILLPDSIEIVYLAPIFSQAGSHLLKISLSNPNGGTDENILNDTIGQIFFIDQSFPTLPIYEGFQTMNFPPTSWSFNDPNSIFYHLTTTGGFGNSDSCLRARFFSTSGYCEVVSPELSFSNLLPPVKLSFSLASAMKNSSSQQSISIYVSTDCASSWIQVYLKEDTEIVVGSPGTELEFAL